MNKKVLVINLGWEQTPLIDRLWERGFELYGVHYNDNYYKNVAFKDILISDLRNLEEILKYAEKIKPDAVISDQCDYSQFAQAVVAQKLKLPGPSIEQAQTGSNKLIQREKSRKAGIKIPEFRLCIDYKEAKISAKEIGYPVILKPIDNRGSFGVNKVSDEAELERYYFDALVNSHSRYVLVERFIPGLHITIDGYVFPGYGAISLALATKKMLGGERQVAMDILYPGELAPRLYSKAMKNNEYVNNSLGFQFGMLHSEYMITEDEEIYLIEVANRGGGVFTSEIIVPAVSGIDLIEQYINDALGWGKSLYNGEISENKTLLKFLSFKAGRIKRFEGLNEIKNNPNVLKFRLTVKPGDVISPITTDANRHGFFIFQSDNGIRSKAEKIVNTIKVIYEQ